VTLSNNTDGQYSVEQLAPVDHRAGGRENNQNFNINYRVTDGDGDVQGGRLRINVDDDTPTVSRNALVRLDDDALADGNPGGRGDNADSQNATGTLAHSFGADGEGTLLLSDTGAPAGFVYSLNGDGTILTISQDGTDVLQVTLSNNTDGQYSVEQLAPVDHRAGGRENNQNFNINYRVTDNDGDVVGGRLRVNVDDDTPTAIADTDNVTEGAALIVDAASGLLSNDNFGADNPAIATVSGVAAGNNTSTALTTGVATAIAGSYGELTLAADGSYSYEATANGITADMQDVFVYTITDTDGDTSTVTLTIDVANTSLVAVNPTVVADEAGLDNLANTSETVTGQLNVTGTGVTYTLTSNTAGNNGDITLNNDGSFSYTLSSAVDSGANPGTNTVNGVETFNYTATDANGNTTTGTISIDVIDDVPTAVIDTGSVTEGATLIVDAASGVLSNDNFGADNPAIANVSGVAAGNNTSTALTTGVATAIAGSYGELTLAADGSYSYEATANGITADMQDVFVYTITDTDGDTSTVTLTIDVANIALVAVNPTVVANETGLPAGNDAASDSETVTGQLTVAGDNVTYSFTPGSNGAGNNGNITLNSDGSFSYTLTSPVDSGANLGTNTVNGVETFNYTATDANGNTVAGTITINVIDDVPTASANALVMLDDDALVDGNPGGSGDNINSQNATGTLAHSFGADGEGTLLLSDTGAPAGFVYSLNGDGTTLTISQDGTDVLQVTLADLTSGDYTVTQLAPINHPEGNDENNQGFNLAYQVTDGDGDTVNGQVNISIDDDSPVVTVNQDVVNDVAYSFTVTNHDEVSSAGYHSSYGYYIKDADGNPTTGTIIWDDVHDNDTAPVSVQGHSPDQIGFFIIPNGDSRNSSLTDDTEVTFQLVNGEWTAFDAGQPLIGNGSPVLFDNAALNKDNEDHVQDNGLIGNQNWEDLPIRTGDADYNDVNVNVDWTSVTASGDAINTVSFGADGAEFGADGPGGIDFTLEEVTILGDLTSNGKDVTFEARDTDSDGYNDLIVGSTEDGDVLTIDGLLDSDDYDLHLFAPVESTNDGADDVQITANLSITDGDGDSAFATLNFNLDINQITEAPAPIDPI
jgi:VCBS repeat-containing protein